jgi:AAT family amino acid transporter
MSYPQLQRGLQSRHISLIALGGIIGSSYFLGTGYLLHEVGPCAFIAYILGGFISYLTLACLGELAVSSPAQGSFINSAAKYISPSWACGVGWSYWFAWVIFVPSECIAGGLILQNFVPHVPTYIWSILLGLIISFTNLIPVKAFGELEFWLALTKIIILLGFCVIAVIIFTGSYHHMEPIGMKYLFGNGGLFPFGVAVLFSNMVFLMSSFQGSEIIGLTASESANPKKAIPSALRKMTFRIVGLYVLPTFLLVLIYPWQDAGLQGNIFSMALIKYGYTPFAHIFSFLIIAGTISTANSGLYATIRTLLALCHKGMGPRFLTKINQQGVPVAATIATLIAFWGLLLICCFVPAHQLYANLLATSGFTGTICWISICWAQLRFRRKLKEIGASLTYKVPFFPYITYFSIWVQIGTLFIVLFNPSLRSSFYFGLPALIIPMCLYKKLKAA